MSVAVNAPELMVSIHEEWRDFLMRRASIDAQGMARAEALAAQTSEQIEWVLIDLGLVTEKALCEAFANYLDLDVVCEEDLPDAPLFEDVLSVPFLLGEKILPLNEKGGTVRVAVSHPMASATTQALRFAFGPKVEMAVGSRSFLQRAISDLYAEGEAASVDQNNVADYTLDDDVERLRDLASEAPMVQFVNMLISDALDARASDIHIENSESGTKIRLRIDGVLQDHKELPRQQSAGIVSRLKIMAGMDISEQRLPQDGRINLPVRGQPVDMRASTLPTGQGEGVVLRLLNQGDLPLDLPSLGFRGDTLHAVTSILEKPNGILLVTGPTGSGKTTTLYAALKTLNTDDRKIITVEDPIEYRLAGVNQTQVKPEIGFSFAAALRSFLRQDPDVMMVGEIRDLETAEVAVQAALTGHTILSTLHTNDAPSAIARLLDMGVEKYLLGVTVNGIIGQRLVRRLCPKCREPYTPSPEVIKAHGLEKISGGKEITLYKEKGCEACGFLGFRGRVAILEVMPMTEDINTLILRDHSRAELYRMATQAGMIPIIEDGLSKALNGMTTLEEVLRVTRDVG